MRGACGVEDELRAVSVVEGGRALDVRAALTQRVDYRAREDGEAARPLIVAQAVGQRRLVGLDALPRAFAHARAPEPARTVDAHGAVGAEDLDRVLGRARLRQRD